MFFKKSKGAQCARVFIHACGHVATALAHCCSLVALACGFASIALNVIIAIQRCCRDCLLASPVPNPPPFFRWVIFYINMCYIRIIPLSSSVWQVPGGLPWQICHGDLLLLPILCRTQDCSIACSLLSSITMASLLTNLCTQDCSIACSLLSSTAMASLQISLCYLRHLPPSSTNI